MFTVKCGYENMVLGDVKALLDQTYWAAGRSDELIRASLKNALCFGVFLDDGRQIAVGRVITDLATAFYLSDIVVDQEYRGMGAGKALMDAIMAYPGLSGLKGMLTTRDAAGFYRKYGFEYREGAYMDRPRS